MKKNSIIYLKDWSILIKSLSKENQLFFWDLFIQYDSENPPICENELVLPIWNFVLSQLDNMNKKYEDTVVKRNRENGQKGGRPPKTRNNPKNPMGYLETQKTLNENKNININNKKNNSKELLQKRKEKFNIEVFSYSFDYNENTLNSFFDYWSEENQSKTKMKFELQKTWNLGLRLKKWCSNEIKFKNNEKSTNITNRKLTADEQLAQRVEDWSRRIDEETSNKEY